MCLEALFSSFYSSLLVFLLVSFFPHYKQQHAHCFTYKHSHGLCKVINGLHIFYKRYFIIYLHLHVRVKEITFSVIIRIAFLVNFSCVLNFVSWNYQLILFYTILSISLILIVFSVPVTISASIKRYLNQGVITCCVIVVKNIIEILYFL